MIRCRVEDWYSDESKAQIEVLEAIRGQVEIHYDSLMRVPAYAETEYGMRRGATSMYEFVLHSLREISYQISMKERQTKGEQ